MASIAEILATYNQLPRGANAQLESVLPALQFQAAQQAHEQGGVGGLLASGFFPQAQQVSAAQLGQATAGLRGAQARQEDAITRLMGGMGGPGTSGPAASNVFGIQQLDRMIAGYGAAGRPTEGLRALREPVGLRQAAQQGDYFEGVDFLQRNAPDLVPKFVASQGGPNAESVRALGTRRGRQVDSLRELGAASSVIENIRVDPANAKGWIYPFTIAVNKLLQEGAVLEGEARAVAEGNMALVEELLVQAESLTDTESAKAAEILERLRNMGLQLAEIKQRYTLDAMQGWDEEDERYGLLPQQRGQVHPGGAVRRMAQEFLDRRQRPPGEMTTEELEAELRRMDGGG